MATTARGRTTGIEAAALAALVGLIGLAPQGPGGRGALVAAGAIALGLSLHHHALRARLERLAERARDAEARAERLRSHDALTGLPNRTTAEAWIDDRLARGVPTGVLAVDVDRLGLLTTSLGHAARDVVVSVLAERTRRVVCGGCAVDEDCFTARGDEDDLLAVVPGSLGLEGLRALGAAVVDAARAPLTIPGHGEVAMSVSVGVALAVDGDDAEGLLDGADLALNEAKRHGRCRVEVLDGALRARSACRVRREQDLRRAVTRHGEIEVWAQPVVELSSGIPVGAEAMVRWRHPFSGVLLPDEVLTAAEDAGMVAEIGASVLDRACRALATGAVPWMTVDLSTRELYDPTLAGRVRDALSRHEIDPDRLCLAVPEGALLDPPGMATLKALEALGVGLAIADFGVGASPLLQLQMLRRPLLKLDRSFVVPLDTSRADRAAEVIAGFVRLARQIDVHLVAEGVETEAQADRLRCLGVRYAQGVRFAPPVALDDVVARDACVRPHQEDACVPDPGEGAWVAWVGPPPWVPGVPSSAGAAAGEVA